MEWVFILFILFTVSSEPMALSDVVTVSDEIDLEIAPPAAAEPSTSKEGRYYTCMHYSIAVYKYTLCHINSCPIYLL